MFRRPRGREGELDVRLRVERLFTSACVLRCAAGSPERRTVLVSLITGCWTGTSLETFRFSFSPRSLSLVFRSVLPSAGRSPRSDRRSRGGERPDRSLADGAESARDRGGEIDRREGDGEDRAQGVLSPLRRRMER